MILTRLRNRALTLSRFCQSTVVLLRSLSVNSWAIFFRMSGDNGVIKNLLEDGVLFVFGEFFVCLRGLGDDTLDRLKEGDFLTQQYRLIQRAIQSFHVRPDLHLNKQVINFQ